MRLPLIITVRQPPEGDIVTLLLEGELDATTVAVLDEQHQMQTTAGRSVDLDLSLVDFIDSAGIGCLVRAHQRASAANLRLRLVAGSIATRAALKLVGLEDWLPTPRALPA